MFYIRYTLCRNGSASRWRARQNRPGQLWVSTSWLRDGTAAKLAAAQPGDADRLCLGSGVSRQPHTATCHVRAKALQQQEGRKETQVKNEIIAWLGATATVLAAGLAGYLLAHVTPAW